MGKIFTTFNHGGITPTYPSTMMVMFFEMFFGVIFLLLATAVITMVWALNTRNVLKADFKSHWKQVLAVVGDTACCKRIMETKKLIWLRYHGLALPGKFTAEDNLLPVDRAIVKNDIIEGVLRYIPVFNNLPSTLRMKLSISAHSFIYAKSQTIVLAGEAIDHMYFIRNGVVRVSDAA